MRKGQRAMSSGPRVLMMCPLVVLPDLLVGNPDRAGDAELVFQFHLPLKGERGGAEDEHGTVIEQSRKHGTGRQRQRFADADFVRQQQPGFSIGFAVLQEHRDERTLPRLKLFAAAIDGTLGQCGGRGVRPELTSRKRDFHAVGDALDFFDDGVRQRE